MIFLRTTGGSVCIVLLAPSLHRTAPCLCYRHIIESSVPQSYIRTSAEMLMLADMLQAMQLSMYEEHANHC